MSTSHKSEVLENKQRTTVGAFLPWAFVAVLAVVALTVSIYRLVFYGPSVVNWVVFSSIVAVSLFYAFAAYYLERVAPAQIDDMGEKLNSLKSRIEKLEKEAEELPEDLIVNEEEWSHENRKVAQ